MLKVHAKYTRKPEVEEDPLARPVKPPEPLVAQSPVKSDIDAFDIPVPPPPPSLDPSLDLPLPPPQPPQPQQPQQPLNEPQVQKVPRRRTDRTTLEKVELIRMYDAMPKTWSLRKMCNFMGIRNISSLTKILKQREIIMNTPANRRRSRAGKFGKLEAVVLEWAKEVQHEAPVTGPAILKKAKEVALELGVQDFHGSTGWLDRFKRRNGISGGRVNPPEVRAGEQVGEFNFDFEQAEVSQRANDRTFLDKYALRITQAEAAAARRAEVEGPPEGHAVFLNTLEGDADSSNPNPDIESEPDDDLMMPNVEMKMEEGDEEVKLGDDVGDIVDELEREQEQRRMNTTNEVNNDDVGNTSIGDVRVPAQNYVLQQRKNIHDEDFVVPTCNEMLKAAQTLRNGLVCMGEAETHLFGQIEDVVNRFIINTVRSSANNNTTA